MLQDVLLVCCTVCDTVCYTVNCAMCCSVCCLCGACMLHSVLLSLCGRSGLPQTLILIRQVLQHTATYCTTLFHTATHLTTLQHTATHCITLQHQMKWWAAVTVVAIPSQTALLMCPYVSSGIFSVLSSRCFCALLHNLQLTSDR